VLRAVACVLSLLFVAIPAGPALAVSPVQPILTASCPTANCEPVVVGDPNNASYVGAGGLLVDNSFSGDPLDRTQLAVCGDCRWWLLPTCWRDPTNSDAGCRALASCPPGWVRMVIWFARGNTRATVVGQYCLGQTGPITLGHIANLLADRFVARLPGLRPGVQPAIGLVGLPMCFRSGQAVRVGPWSYSLVGFRVTLRAVTSWTWNFGDGVTLATVDPGGKYPNLHVSHVYRKPGTVVVRLSSSWTGTYTVDGLGPFVISPQVRQLAALSLPLREARAVLIDPA
jgi:hypothetical protein